MIIVHTHGVPPDVFIYTPFWSEDFIAVRTLVTGCSASLIFRQLLFVRTQTKCQQKRESR